MSQATHLPRIATSPSATQEGERRFGVEDRFRLLVDAVTDYAVFMLDPDGIVSTWNAGAQRIKGYQASEIVGRHFSVFYPVESVAMGLPTRMLDMAAADGEYVNEGWRLRKDGSRFWASVVITALHAEDGTLLGFGKVTRDLTERRAAEDSLRTANQRQIEISAELAEANAYLKNIFNASTLVAIIATDLRGIITLFNCGAERMLGYAAEEIVGIHTPALLHLPEEVASRGRELSSALGRQVEGFDVFVSSIGHSTFDHLDWTYLRRDGTHITVTLSLSAVVDRSGNAIGYLGVAEDITEHRAAARNLAVAYQQLNSVLECMSDCVMTIGRDWTIVYANRRTLETLPACVLGRVYWECFPSIVGTPTDLILRHAMETQTGASYERFVDPPGIWFKVRTFPSEVGLTAFFNDITEEKKLQELIVLEQVMREKRIEALSHMAGGLAHEISNPLAIIHARASDLKAQAESLSFVPAEFVVKASDSIVNTADRAIRILRGLRGFGREASNDPREWASIEGIVDQCLEMQQSRFERHGIALRVDLHPDLPLLLCRETQIGQILTNLLNNAFDAVDQSDVTKRWVTLTAERSKETVLIHVTDSGPGIDDDLRPRLMEPFFTTKAKGLGMGVGLSLSRAIAQDHGGSLALCHQHKPTCFELILPLDTTVLDATVLDATVLDATVSTPD
jgi:PAS domain S-box-containing protein